MLGKILGQELPSNSQIVVMNARPANITDSVNSLLSPEAKAKLEQIELLESKLN